MFADNVCVYNGSDLTYIVPDLKPYHVYNFALKACADDDESALSDMTTVTTDESSKFFSKNLLQLWSNS